MYTIYRVELIQNAAFQPVNPAHHKQVDEVWVWSILVVIFGFIMRGFSPPYSGHHEAHIMRSSKPMFEGVKGALAGRAAASPNTRPEATVAAPSSYTRKSQKPLTACSPLGSRQIKAQVTNTPATRNESER